MKILITGGFGYIGGRLAQFLFQRGHSVYLGTRHQHNPPDWLPQANVVRMSWGGADELEQACKEMDAVIHTAGMNAYDCANDPAGALEFNGLSTIRLLQAATRQLVRRFIYLSTAHVYCSPLMGTITEETPTTNLHPYATSHRAGEEAVLRSSQRGELKGIVIRLSNAFGAPMHKDTNSWSLLFNDLCRQAVTTSAMILNSGGMQRRDFIPLLDACRAIEHLLSMPNDNLQQGVFNVGGEWAPTVWEVANLIQQQCQLVFNFQPTLSRAALPVEEQCHAFEYQSMRLTQTGFKYKVDRMAEIKNLLAFCRMSFL